jgi:bifunctional DNA-binding transcriptional regulator/antitoxin component of YhaV-PrlF toxin-antitoxin module
VEKLTRVINVEKEERILGTSKVGPKHRITLVKSVQEKLFIGEGDLIVYVEDEKGRIYLKPSRTR